MESITATIVAAVVAGAVAGTKDMAAQAVKDAYKGLRDLIIKRFGKKADVEDALRKVETKPDSGARQTLLQEELVSAGAGQDAEVIARARELLELARQQGLVSYHAVLRGSGAVAQGSSVAAGEGGIAIGGDVQGEIHIEDRAKDK